jgi:hypothetical protein
MNFKIWIEEAGLGSNATIPDIQPPTHSPINRGSDTPASDEVKRTGLQPQVDAKSANGDDNQDELLAIDAKIEDMEKEIPESDSPKVNQFKSLWDEFKAQWDQIKMTEEPPDPTDQGFGDMEDPEYDQMMQSHPNMVPGADQGPHGPGVFGQS